MNCYRGFGTSDWMPVRIGESTAHEDVVLSERPAPFHAPWQGLPALEQTETPAYGLRD
jgi:hypothetical protein